MRALRVGIVNTESSHVDHLVRYCNVEQRAGTARVVLSVATSRDVGVPRVDLPTQMIGEVDAVMVCDRDGLRHAEQALPFLEAGLPVFVDKPFATTVCDAEAMIMAADRYGALLTSYSPLRWLPEVRALRPLGPPSSLVLTGPVDPAGPYRGVHFYGVHLADMAALLTTGAQGALHVVRSRGGIVVTTTYGDSAVTLNMVQPGTGSMPFSVTHAKDGIVSAREVPLGHDYLSPALDAFFTMVRTGEPPIPYQEMLRPVRLLAQIERALAELRPVA